MGNRRTKRQILESKLEEQDKKIHSTEERLKLLKQKRNEIQQELKEMIAAEERERQKAEERELLCFIKTHNITREDLEKLI